MIKYVFSVQLLLGLSISINVQAQAEEIQQLLLDVEKLVQLKGILSDLKKGYEIISGGYSQIKNISEGNFHLHEQFLNNLLQVSPAVKSYKRVADIVSAQLRLVREYKTALRQFKGSGQFTIDELAYIGDVYANLLAQSLKNLEALGKVLTDGALRMSDDERLSAIDNIYKDIEDQLSFLRHFNAQTKLLALQRMKEGNELQVMKQLYLVK